MVVFLMQGFLLSPTWRSWTTLSCSLYPLLNFEWSTEAEPTQASRYLPYISSVIKGVIDDQQYCMFDAWRYTKLLTVTGM